MEPFPRWRFRAMRPGEINIDPIEGEFFTTEALGSLNDALVRESIQNSLDAAAGDEPVTVRLSFLTLPMTEPGTRRMVEACLQGLGPHLRARHAGLPAPPDEDEDFDYLLVEDYGTRGLQGDTGQYDDLDEDTARNDFYYFWRNIGRTRKGDTDLGRWGLGKTVFPAASRINAFFGLTTRADDRRTLLMGQSVLRIHKVDGRRFAPYGFFARFDQDLPLPVEDRRWIAAFANHFGLERADRPGLSILVPYPERDIDAAGCVKSAIRHYFFPILAGRLVFELRKGGKTYRIDARSLDDYLRRSEWPERQGLLGMVDLARWAIAQPPAAYIQLAAPPAGKVPKLTHALLSPEQLQEAARRLAGGRRLAFRVPVWIQRRKDKRLSPASFDVFLEKDDALERAEDHFIRQGITIPEVSSLKHKGVRAIVSVSDPRLSAFLGDAENPAHTEWERNSRQFKMKYIRGPRTLDFVKTSPREIVKILTQPQKGRDENLLKHLFALPAVPETADEQRPGTAAAAGTEGDMTPVAEETLPGAAGTGYLQLSPIRGGFRLARRPKATRVPRRITVQVAYEVRGGNPFKRYHPMDFDLRRPPIEVRLEGARLLACGPNALKIEVEHGNFRLSVVGFDPHRDLRVKTIP